MGTAISNVTTAVSDGIGVLTGSWFGTLPGSKIVVGGESEAILVIKATDSRTAGILAKRRLRYPVRGLTNIPRHRRGHISCDMYLDESTPELEIW